MGDYAGSYEHTGDEEVKYVVHEDWSWMHNTGTEDAGALKEGENVYEEEEYYKEEEEYYKEEEEYNYEAGINLELEYSYTCDSSQQVAVEGGSEPIRSASKGHQVVLVEDASESSKSSQDDKPKPKPKTKKTKGSRRRFKHLQEPSLDASSDPGYGGSSESFHPEDPRSLSINLVTSWLHGAALEEHPKDGMHAQHGSIPPQRLPPPRRLPPGTDMGAHSSRRSSSLPGPVPQYEYEAQDCGNTPAWDPSGSQYQGYEEDHRVALYDASADKPSVYRLETKPLDKAFRFMRTGAAGLAQVSRTAAIGFGNASRVAAVAVKSKTMEMRSLAVPVFTPIINAVLEESKEQLMGADQGRGRAAPASSMGGGPGRGRGRGPGRGPGSGPGRGQGPAGPPHPMMRPGMPAGPGPGMRPVMRPGMPARPGPGMRPLMRPGMPLGPGPGMRPVMRPGMRPGMSGGPGPGMRPVMRPGMRPVMRPGMGPPGHPQGMAGGQARGPFRPVGVRPVPPQPTDF